MLKSDEECAKYASCATPAFKASLMASLAAACFSLDIVLLLALRLTDRSEIHDLAALFRLSFLVALNTAATGLIRPIPDVQSHGPAEYRTKKTLLSFAFLFVGVWSGSSNYPTIASTMFTSPFQTQWARIEVPKPNRRRRKLSAKPSTSWELTAKTTSPARQPIAGSDT